MHDTRRGGALRDALGTAVALPLPDQNASRADKLAANTMTISTNAAAHA